MAKLKDIIGELKSLEKKIKATWDGDQSSGLCRRRLSYDEDGKVEGYFAEANCDGEVDYGTFSVAVGGVEFSKSANEYDEEQWHTDDSFDEEDESDFQELMDEAVELLEAKVSACAPDYESFTDYQWTRDDIEDAVGGIYSDYKMFAKNADGDVFAFEEELEDPPEGLVEIDEDEAVELLAPKNLPWELI